MDKPTLNRVRCRKCGYILFTSINKGEIDMRDYLENIKEDLELFSDEGLTITVSRKDLENLVSAHENLLKGKMKKKENEFER